MTNPSQVPTREMLAHTGSFAVGRGGDGGGEWMVMVDGEQSVGSSFMSGSAYE